MISGRTNNRITILVQRFIVWDIGFAGLKNALRGTLSVLVSFIALGFAAGKLSQPVPYIFPAVMAALMASLLVNDKTRKSQKKTAIALVIPAVLGLTFSVVLSPFQVLHLSLFLLIAFGAVAVRRYGTRWASLGILGFMSYFFPIFFPIPLQAIPLIICSTVFSVLVSFCFRFYFFPDRPSNMLRSYRKAFKVHLTLIFIQLYADLNQTISSGRREIQVRLAVYRILIARLNELCLAIEDFLKTSDAHAIKTKSEAFQMTLFERELSMRTVMKESAALQSYKDAPSKLLEHTKDAVGLALAILAKQSDRMDLELVLGKMREESRRASETIQLSTETLCLNLEEVLRDYSSIVPDSSIIQEIAAEQLVQTDTTPAGKTLHITTRQAIQATIAIILASTAGFFVSPSRWYWAAITAFVVFAGLTRGETMLRAVYRIAGTVAGLIVGFIVTGLLLQESKVELALVVLCVFGGLYGARFSFGFWSAGIFTLMLAVLLDVLGQLTFNVLLLRLEETVIGALAGAVVSFFVLPSSTRDAVKTSAAKLLREEATLFSKLPLEGDSFHSKKEVVTRLRTMDKALLDLKTISKPLTTGRSFERVNLITLLLHDISVLCHYSRHIATYRVADVKSFDCIKACCLKISQALLLQANRFGEEKTETPDSTNSTALVEGIEDPYLRHILMRIEDLLQSLSTRKI